MDELRVAELRIRIERADDRVTIRWEGVSEARDPGTELVPYLDKLVEGLHGAHVWIDFCAMEYMNSATIAPILRFIRALDKECPQVTVIYDRTKTFQRTTFSAIKALGIVLSKLEVIARDPAENPS